MPRLRPNRACSRIWRTSPCTGTKICGLIQLYSAFSSGFPGWPDTWISACRSVTRVIPCPASVFWIRPMAISLPGIWRLENSTTSPVSSPIGWLPSAIRAKAARGSPCPPVAMISTSPRGRSIASSMPMISGMDFRYPQALATPMIRSSERPATHSWRPVFFATSPSVCSRATLEAKVVTSTRLPL